MDTEIARSLADHRFVTDGGLETDLIFNHDVDLPGFASFPLLDGADGRRLLRDYYRGYIDVAAGVGAGFLLEAPTWRANPQWGAQLGYDGGALDRVNRDAIAFLAHLRGEARATHEDGLGPVLVSGVVGPRGDGYAAARGFDPDEAAAYHGRQIAAFAAEGADLVTAYTLTDTGEAIGIVRAARDHGLPVFVSFTVETDGRLPDGTGLADAIAIVDAEAPPDGFGVNCAHPHHVRPGIDASDADWRERIVITRVNASTLSHAELDDSADLHDGDPDALAAEQAELTAQLPGLRVMGGCCGTDVRHVAAMWGVTSTSPMTAH